MCHPCIKFHCEEASSLTKKHFTVLAFLNLLHTTATRSPSEQNARQKIQCSCLLVAFLSTVCSALFQLQDPTLLAMLAALLSSYFNGNSSFEIATQREKAVTCITNSRRSNLQVVVPWAHCFYAIFCIIKVLFSVKTTQLLPCNANPPVQPDPAVPFSVPLKGDIMLLHQGWMITYTWYCALSYAFVCSNMVLFRKEG